MPRPADPDPPLPALFTAVQARSTGLTSDQIRQRVRSGTWLTVGRGMYRRTDGTPDEYDDHARERLEHSWRAVAAVLRNPGCVIGNYSAAVVHGLPLFLPLPEEVCLLVPPGHWTGRRSGIAFRTSSDRLGVAGTHRVTGPARTWIDVARWRSLADALCVGDAALRQGLFAVEAFGVSDLPTGRGSRRVPFALGHLSALRESPLESGSWAYFVEHALPLPAMQVEYRDPLGMFIGRVDFAWKQFGVIGECDGRLKYTDRSVLYAEKRREDALRALGLTVVRWGMSDLRSAGLARRLRGVLR